MVVLLSVMLFRQNELFFRHGKAVDCFCDFFRPANGYYLRFILLDR